MNRFGIAWNRVKVRDRIPGGRELWFYGLTVGFVGIGWVYAKKPSRIKGGGKA